MYDVVKFTYTVHTLHTLKQPFAALAIVLIAIIFFVSNSYQQIGQRKT